MNTIYLLRHAKAEPAIKHAWDPADDKNRSLTLSGVQDAAKVGDWFARKSIRPGIALVSDATRALETWQHLSASAQMKVPMRVVPALYLAPAEQILTLVNELTDSFTSVLIIAHNPGLADLVGEELSTASLASAQTSESWRGLDRTSLRWRVRTFR